MPFEELKEGRARGERYPKGFIKRKILLYLSLAYPKAIAEPDLRDILFDEWKVKTPRVVKNHLSDLEEKEWIEKESQEGKANLWGIDPDLNHFEEIAKKFLDSEDRFDFIETDYVQKKLTDRYIDSKIGNLQKELEPIISRIDKQIPDLTDVLERFSFPNEIFRKSPLALHFLVSPRKAKRELKPLLSTLANYEWVMGEIGKISKLAQPTGEE